MIRLRCCFLFLHETTLSTECTVPIVKLPVKGSPIVESLINVLPIVELPIKGLPIVELTLKGLPTVNLFAPCDHFPNANS